MAAVGGRAGLPRRDAACAPGRSASRCATPTARSCVIRLAAPRCIFVVARPGRRRLAHAAAGRRLRAACSRPARALDAAPGAAALERRCWPTTSSTSATTTSRAGTSSTPRATDAARVGPVAVPRPQPGRAAARPARPARRGLRAAGGLRVVLDAGRRSRSSRPLVLADRIRDGYVFMASMVWVWILGVASYYLIPSLGPVPLGAAGVRGAAAHDDPGHPGALPGPARPPAGRTRTRADAFAQVSAFASLHVGVTGVIVLMLRYYGLRRLLAVMASSWPAPSWPRSTWAGTSSSTTSPGVLIALPPSGWGTSRSVPGSRCPGAAGPGRRRPPRGGPGRARAAARPAGPRGPSPAAAARWRPACAARSPGRGRAVGVVEEHGAAGARVRPTVRTMRGGVARASQSRPHADHSTGRRPAARAATRAGVLSTPYGGRYQRGRRPPQPSSSSTVPRELGHQPRGGTASTQVWSQPCTASSWPRSAISPTRPGCRRRARRAGRTSPAAVAVEQVQEQRGGQRVRPVVVGERDSVGADPCQQRGARRRRAGPIEATDGAATATATAATAAAAPVAATAGRGAMCPCWRAAPDSDLTGGTPAVCRTG